MVSDTGALHSPSPDAPTSGAVAVAAFVLVSMVFIAFVSVVLMVFVSVVLLVAIPSTPSVSLAIGSSGSTSGLPLASLYSSLPGRPPDRERGVRFFFGGLASS
jgi:hypothetical protein